jgi:hypothetical protein
MKPEKGEPFFFPTVQERREVDSPDLEHQREINLIHDFP